MDDSPHSLEHDGNRVRPVRLARVYVGSALTAGLVLELPRDAANHLARVLRGRSGDQVVLFSGDGREHAAVIESVRGTRVLVSVGTGFEVSRESPLAVTLVQSVPRGDRMDFIVQKATELGVARLVPVFSQRSVVRLDAAQARAKTEHWRAVAASACEQCGRNSLPHIALPAALLTYLGTATSITARWVLDPDAEPAALLGQVPAEVEIAIGPEGGFGDDELDAFRLAGFTRLCLGPRILRAETAALAGLSWLQARFGDMRGIPRD